MVKVYGPMFSLGASGTLANAVTFSTWKGRPYVRERVIPSNPKSGAQTGRRAMMKWLTQNWPSINAAGRATYDDLAEQLIVSNFNAMISYNMKRWHNFAAPTYASPAGEAKTVGTDAGPHAAAWEENRIAIGVQLTATNDNNGVIIFASPTAAFTTAVGNAIILHKIEDLDLHTIYWTPPSVQEWHFDTRYFTNDGVLGAEVGEFSAAP